MINNGANINHVDSDEQTALHIAAANGNIKVARLLIENGANVSSVDNYGWTALHIAASEGHPEFVEFLIQVNWMSFRKLLQVAIF